MPLDAQTQSFLKLLDTFPPMVLDAVQLRKREKMGLPDLSIERALVDRVIDQTIAVAGRPDIPIRIFHPAVSDRFGELPPVLIYFHGGGHTVGSLDGYDGLCCQLCKQSGCVVVSVDYRLAPENKFPAATEDCYSALEWVSANGAALGADATRIAVAGDSAGGNLSAVVCLMARDRCGPRIGFQVLYYPNTNGRGDTESKRRNGQGYLLTEEAMDWFATQYLSRPEERQDPYFAPLKAGSHSSLPPALVVTAEFDPLLDEGAAYAKSLRDAGVPVEYVCYDGTIHGFISFYQMIDKGRHAISLAATHLRRAFG